MSDQNTALPDQRDLYELVFRSINDALILTDLKTGKVLEANPEAQTLLGRSREALLTLSLGELLPSESEFLNPEGVQETELCSLDGTNFPVEMKWQVFEYQQQPVMLNAIRRLSNSRKIEQKVYEQSQILTQIDGSVVVTDSSGKITTWNKGASQLYGYSEEEMLGKHISLIYPKGAYMSVAEQSASLRAGNDHEVIEVEAQRKNCEKFVCRLVGYLLKAEDGSPVGIAYYSSDLSDFKKKERELRESEQLFRSITNAAQDAIVILNPEGEISYWNAAAHRVFGYSEEEAIGQTAHRLITPERYQEKAHRGWNGFQEKGEGPVIGQTLELNARRKDGQEVPIELSVSSVKIQGRWHGLGIARDISERVEAEEMLKHKEEGLAKAQKIAHLGNWEFDIVQNRLTWSDEIYSIFEVVRENFQNDYESLLKIVHPEDREKLDRAYKTSVENQVPFRITHRLLMPDGRIKYVREKGETRYGESNEPLLSFGTLQDITREYLAEQNLSNSNRALKTLSRGNKVLTRATDEVQLLEDMCRVVIEEASYRLAWIGYAEEDEAKTLRPVAYAGYEQGYLEKLNLTWDDKVRGRGPAGTAVRNGVPVIIKDVKSDPKFLPWREDAIQRGYASVLSLPIKDERKSFACLNIYSAEEGVFNEDEIKLLTELAEDIAFGILSLRMHQERDHFQAAHLKMAERHKKALISTIRAIAMTVEKRDPYTAGHQQRVADLSVEIGRELGLSEQRLEGIKLGAMIHDIGKIYVPSELLNRPGRLTDTEFELIKSHAEVGYEIMKDVELPWPVADMIRQHHERCNGSGYPQGLKGEDIILEARILAVSDVVEAITAHRPYRAALGIEIALEELEKHRGVLYDSAVVDACLNLIRQKDYQFKAQTF